MAQIYYPLYDNALFGTTAGATKTLFQVNQGGQTTKGFTITNMRGNGQLPEQESFTLQRIRVAPNDASLTADDWSLLFLESILTLEYNNTKVLQVPLIMCASYSAYGGVIGQDTGAALTRSGEINDGLMIEPNLDIRGATNFKVDIYQGLAVDNADQQVVCILDGILDAPNININ